MGGQTVYFLVLSYARAAVQRHRGISHVLFLVPLRSRGTRLARCRSQAEPLGPSPR